MLERQTERERERLNISKLYNFKNETPLIFYNIHFSKGTHTHTHTHTQHTFIYFLIYI